MTARLVGVAAFCAIAFVALGIWVSHHALSRLDVESVALRGTGVPFAILFTNFGYGTVLTLVGVATVAGAFVVRAPVAVPLAILASQLASQGVVNAIKNAFGRERPDAWIYRHELGFSYPSGHATTAVVFYGVWLVVVWFAPLPLAVRAIGAGILAVWVVGIGWSRIALGAHYPTDVLGGYLFGIAWVCALGACASALPAGSPLRIG